MTDLKLPEPSAWASVARDGAVYYLSHDKESVLIVSHGRDRIVTGLHTDETVRAYATAAVLAEREARGKALADGYAGSMFGTSPSSGDQQRVVLYYKTAEQALAAHDWLCDTLDAAMGGDDAR